MNKWMNGLMDWWINGLLDCWAVGLEQPDSIARSRIHPPIHSSTNPLIPLRTLTAPVALAVALLASGCGEKLGAPAAATNDPHLTTNGTVEVTAKLVEIPDGAIFKRDLYDYATILKYQVLQVHRGQVDGDTIYVGHYNPWKPRSEAADKRAPKVGGNARQFQAGQTHRLALNVPIEDHFMGGIVNKYFGRTTNALYWAVWTDLAANP
jgi:hypothetical protein